MKCIIPGPNVKVFGRAVHSLSKIGDELYFEPLEHGLALRTVNSSRSAYACFIFSSSFFLHYTDGARTKAAAADQSDDEALKCKIGMKSCLTIFKSLATLDKTVDKCKISLDLDESRLIFQMLCKHGITKTHNLTFIECETLQAVFTRNMMPNVLQAQTKLLSDAVVNFQTTQEEVTLIVDPEKASLKNYIEEDTDPLKAVHTALSLDPEEFDNYQVGIDTEVTFCLKELRAVLSFTDPAMLPLSISFEVAGKPIVFSVDSDPSFEANFVLATLAEKGPSPAGGGPPSSQSIRAPPSQPTRSNISRVSRTPAASRGRPNKHETPRPDPSRTHNHSTITPRASTSTSSHTETFRKPSAASDARGIPPEGAAADRGAGGDGNTNRNNGVNHSAKKQPITEKTPSQHQHSALHSQRSKGANLGESRGEPEVVRNESVPSLLGGRSEFTLPEDTHNDSCSPPIPVLNGSVRPQLSIDVRSRLLSDTEDEEDEDEVPGTPPSKKLKRLFSGFSQSTTSGSQQHRPSTQAVVLAEDTDDDD